MGFLDRPRVSAAANRLLGADPAQRSAGRALVTPTHLPMPTLDNAELMAMFKKSMGDGPTSGMFGGGWQGAANSRYRTGSARFTSLLNAYGGTEDSVVWVFACVGMVASTLASYPWRLVNQASGETVDRAPQDLIRLLEQPNPDWTYFDLAEQVVTDLEMVGNGYILKNERNGRGQPGTLFRLRPDRVRIAVAQDGTEIGYVYSPLSGEIAIPYDFEEVIHYRYPNPLDDHYGMGTVEAIATSLDRHTAQGLHLTGYFQNGARISGVLTIPETLTETQFERMKESWRENYAGPANAYKLLIAEGSADYKAVSQTPVASGVVDLMRLGKDEILSGFGMPAPLLGGVLENANYKMTEAQHVFLRSMIPRARRFSERLTVDLVSLWGLGFRVDPHANEPLEVRLAHAKEAIGAGATVQEAREMAGLPPSADPNADKILVANNLIPLDIVGLPPRPATSMPMEARGESGAEPPPALPGSTAPAGASLEEQMGALHEAMQAAKEAEIVLAPPTQVVKGVLSALDAAEGAWGALAKDRAAKAASALGAAPQAPLAGVWTPPTLPAGFEQTSPAREHSDLARAVREHQAAALATGVGVFGDAFRQFFREQRNRVLSKLSSYGARAARGGRTKASLTPEALFDLAAENEALQRAYLPALDQFGESALPMPMVLSGGLSWDVVNPRVAALRTELAGKVTRVNDTTRAAISEQVAEGLRRGYSVVQIANGYPEEKFGGILGVFDQASGARAELIARTESAFAYNGAQAADYRETGTQWVEILDGTEFDTACADADGQVWSLDEYEANPLEHPNCSRTAVPSELDPEGNPADGAAASDGG